MMEKKQLQAIFLYEFKLGHKATKATRNSAFGQGTANERTMQRWFQKFRNGDESPEDEESHERSAVGNNELKMLVEADPRITIQELTVKLHVSHPTVLDHFRQLGKSKRRGIWML